MDSFAIFSSLVSIVFLIIPILIAYFVIRLAVRHAIESSETGRIIKEMYQNGMMRNKEE